MIDEVTIAQNIALAAEMLGDPTRAEAPDEFPRDSGAAAAPGLYAWWADGTALAMLARVLEAPLAPLIYAGQAGAASGRVQKLSCATLDSRIRNNHIGGNVRASTFRHTLAAVVHQRIGLEVVGPGRLTPASEIQLSSWIRQHLRIGIYPCSDRVNLGAIEHGVLALLDPPLNLKGMSPSPVRGRLREVRRQFARGE